MLRPLEVSITPPSTTYTIWIEPGILDDISRWMPQKVGKVIIITDDMIRPSYGVLVATKLKQKGYECLLLSFPAGESCKNIQTKSLLEEQMLAQGCGRDSLILALGGGVVGDLAGFVAATYMRGIPYIQIPTSLLAMVDSSVGGKTGIDTPDGKNLIGAFWQPSAVVADLNCLKTLPKVHLINGLVEVLKIFLVRDQNSLFDFQRMLDACLSYDATALRAIVHQAVYQKIAVVTQDEKDNNLRAILNFGHTIGHALEYLSHYTILHGHAVALGMLVEAKIAQLLGFIEESDYQWIQSQLAKLNINYTDLGIFSAEEVIRRTAFDKKNRNNMTHYILLNGLGKVHQSHHQFSHPIKKEIVHQAFYAVLQTS